MGFAAIASSRHRRDISADTPDHTADRAGLMFVRTQARVLWVDAVDVFTNEGQGAIVALGDSITDCCNLQNDSNARWIDVVARRLEALPSGDQRRRSVVNAGNTAGLIGGPDINRGTAGLSGLPASIATCSRRTG